MVTVRHPAAFACSLKRLGWSFDFNDLLCQPLLMRDRLEPYRGEMEAISADDLIGQGSLLWKLIYRSVLEDCQKGLKLRLVRHEDLSLEPLDSFRDLYHSLGLSFNHRAERAILNAAAQTTPRSLQSTVHSTRVNSASTSTTGSAACSPRRSSGSDNYR